MKIGEAIYTLLSGATEVTDIVSTNIFPVVAVEKTSVPYIVYHVISEIPTNTKGMGVDFDPLNNRSPLDIDRVQISGYTDTYEEGVDLAEAIRQTLDRETYDSASLKVDNIIFVNMVDDYEKKVDDKGVFVKHNDYQCRIRNSTLI